MLFTSIIWLVGEGVFYVENIIELMQNYTVSQLEQKVAENQSTVDQMVSDSLNYSSIADNVSTLSGLALSLFLAYELL